MAQKIDRKKLNQMLSSGKSQKEVAQYFGVTGGAVSKAKKELGLQIVRTMGLERAGEVVEQHLDTLAQLRRINDAINSELDRAKRDIQEKNADKRGIQEIIIKLCAEVRKQLDLQVSIAATWHDVKQTGEFQEEVLRILDEMEPGTRERVLFALKERGALRGAVTLPGPPLR